MAQSSSGDGLLIFDCDGVLVDSEVISVDVLGEVLRGEGLAVDAPFIYRNFLGRSMDAVREILHADFGYSLQERALSRIRERMRSRLTRELLPVPGIAEALRRMSARRCVASSSRPERIRLSLEVTALLDQFEPNIFSSTMVKQGKPAPDLFLHAARRMGYEPRDCIVIEDSPAGVEAAKRAGMRVYAFAGASHAAHCELHSTLAALAPDAIFDNMLCLPELLAEEPRVH